MDILAIAFTMFNPDQLDDAFLESKEPYDGAHTLGPKEQNQDVTNLQPSTPDDPNNPLVGGLSFSFSYCIITISALTQT